MPISIESAARGSTPPSKWAVQAFFFFEKLKVELKNHVTMELPILGSDPLSAIQST